MTPETKARELVKKYWDTCNCTIAGTSTIFAQIAKQCAIIAVNEILDENSANNVSNDMAWVPDSDGKFRMTNEQFWESVKAEIEKL